MILTYMDLWLIFIITIHWGYATGKFLALITDWSIPRFLIICLLTRYLFI